jgi:hypothetical protein
MTTPVSLTSTQQPVPCLRRLPAPAIPADDRRLALPGRPPRSVSCTHGPAAGATGPDEKR